MEHNYAFDTELEETIIGSMLYDPACIAEVVEVVKPHHFYHQQYQRLCEKIFELWLEDETLVNLVELAPFIEKHQISVSKLTEVVGSIVTTASIRHHALRLRDLWALREAIKIGYNLTNKRTCGRETRSGRRLAKRGSSLQRPLTRRPARRRWSR